MWSPSNVIERYATHVEIIPYITAFNHNLTTYTLIEQCRGSFKICCYITYTSPLAGGSWGATLPCTKSVHSWHVYNRYTVDLIDDNNRPLRAVIKYSEVGYTTRIRKCSEIAHTTRIGKSVSQLHSPSVSQLAQLLMFFCVSLSVDLVLVLLPYLDLFTTLPVCMHASSGGYRETFS